MAGITQAEAEAKLAEYLAAETAINTAGQDYTIKDRRFTRADLKEIREGIKFWNGMVKELSRGQSGRRVRGCTPMD
jgi:hypothetical protein